MAVEVVSTEPNVDQQLEALLNPKPAAPAAAPDKGATPEAGKTPAQVASPAPGETPAEDPLLKALDAIEEEKPEDPPVAPKLSTEQEQILRAVPDVNTVTRLYQTVENYTNFAGAFESGKFEEVEGMFKHAMPTQFDSFLDHIYEKNIEAWVDRFIAEQEGRGTEHKGVKVLEQKLAKLQAQIDQAGKPDLEAEAVRRQQQSFTQYNTHVESLFEGLNFAKKDRKYVKATLDAAVVADPKLITAIRSGNTKAVNGLFKTVLRDYVNRDKEVSTETAATLEAQGKKKLPLGSAASNTGGDEIPEDINQVKKEDREKWVDRGLAALFGKKK